MLAASEKGEETSQKVAISLEGQIFIPLGPVGCCYIQMGLLLMTKMFCIYVH